MKYVPSLPPPASGADAGPGVNALAGGGRAKPVQARALPPLVVRPRAQHEAPPEAAAKGEQRHDPHFHGERHTYCRRTELLPVLIELRSGVEWRRHNQRAGDIAEQST